MASAPSSADTGAIGPSAPRLIDGFTVEEWLQWISEQGILDDVMPPADESETGSAAIPTGLIAEQSQLLASMAKRLDQQEVEYDKTFSKKEMAAEAIHRQKLHKMMVQKDKEIQQLKEEHRRQLQETGVDDLRRQVRRLERDNASLRKENERLEASLSKSSTLESELKHERERADKAEANRESDRLAHFNLRNTLHGRIESLLKNLKEVALWKAEQWLRDVDREERQLDEAKLLSTTSLPAAQSPMFRGQTGRLQLEDLKRHGNVSKASYTCGLHREALQWWLGRNLPEQPLDAAPDADITAPVTAAQCLTSLEVLWSPLGSQSLEYARKCKALNRTDPNNVPAARSDKGSHFKIIGAYASVLFAQNRKFFKQQILSIGISQDVRGSVEFIRARAVAKSMDVCNFVLDVHDIDGSKASLDKARQIWESVESFAKGDEKILSDFRKSVKDRQVCKRALTWRMDSEMGHLQGLRCVLRCALHKGQRSLESAIAADERCNMLIDGLITAYSTSSTDHGSLARGLRNTKLKSMFAEHCQKDIDALDGHLTKLTGFRFAAQRFDTILEVARLIVLHIRPIVHSLVHLKLSDAKYEKWGSKMLSFFTAPNLLLLSLIAELAASCSHYHHRFDNKGAKATMICKMGYWYGTLKAELDRLFTFNDGSPPLVLSPDFTAGFVQTMRTSYDLLVTETIIAGGKLQFYRKGLESETSLRKQVAAELGSIQNVMRLYLQSVDPGDHAIASSLRPFDLDYWQQHFSDESSTFEPLAQIIGHPARARFVNAADLASQYLACRPTALQLQRQGVSDNAWLEAAKHWGDRLVVLRDAVSFMSSVFASTAEIEQQFSLLQMLASGRKSHTTLVHLRDAMKECDRSTSSNATVQSILKAAGMSRVRQLEPKTVKGVTLAGQKRKRQDQLNNLVPAKDAEDAAELEAVTQEAALSRRGKDYEKLCKTLQENSKRQKKRFAEDALPQGSCRQDVRKLHQHEKKRKELLETVRRLDRRELHCVSLAQPELSKCSTVAVALTADDETDLMGMGLKTVLWQNTTQQFESLMQVRNLVWFCRDPNVEIQCFLASGAGAVSGFVMATRLLGGFLGTAEWFKVCQAHSRIVQPPACVKPALWERAEVCFHKSLEADPSLPDAAIAIGKAVEASVKVRNPSLWQLRGDCKQVTSKEAFILISASVSDCESKLGKLKQKAVQEGKLGSACSFVQLLRAISVWV
ncbi:unnamed protein product [Symbiodinium microadriaticum]|nr:unnamed protein product [Symbiodinium microadriaticum]CAE7946509.1 unnamed protein product [Symbiodinium sp. KB8]